MVAKKEDVDSVLQKCKAGVDVRDPRGEVDDVLQECQRVILDLRKMSEDLCLIITGEPGCGDISRELRTRADAERILGYTWKNYK